MRFDDEQIITQAERVLKEAGLITSLRKHGENGTARLSVVKTDRLAMFPTVNDEGANSIAKGLIFLVLGHNFERQEKGSGQKHIDAGWQAITAGYRHVKASYTIEDDRAVVKMVDQDIRDAMERLVAQQTTDGSGKVRRPISMPHMHILNGRATAKSTEAPSRQ